MSKIKLNGKLSLNKERISKLNDDQMDGVKGGLFNSRLFCSRRCATSPAGCPGVTRDGCSYENVHNSGGEKESPAPGNNRVGS